MCPITIPDPEAEALDAIAVCTELFGEGNFSSRDVSDVIEAARSRIFQQHIANRLFEATGYAWSRR